MKSGFLKHHDVYGYPIEFKYNKASTFKTK